MSDLPSSPKSAVELLEAALGQARSGAITAVAVAIVRNGRMDESFYGDDPKLYAAVASSASRLLGNLRND